MLYNYYIKLPDKMIIIDYIPLNYALTATFIVSSHLDTNTNCEIFQWAKPQEFIALDEYKIPVRGQQLSNEEKQWLMLQVLKYS